MTVREYLNFMYDLKKCALPRQRHIAEICKVLKIEDVYGRLIKNLSKGYKQRVGIAQAILGNPEVIILDEPMVGLDPHTANQVRRFFYEHSRSGNLVIFSSHNLDTVEKVCDRVYIIDQGRILQEIDMAAFKSPGCSLENYFLLITQRVAKV